MKKMLALLMAMSLIGASLIGCGSGKGGEDAAATNSDTQAAENTDAQDEDGGSEEGGAYIHLALSRWQTVMYGKSVCTALRLCSTRRIRIAR